MKKVTTIFTIPVFVGIVSILSSIFFTTSFVSAISEPQSDAIIHNCASIKQSLRTLQRTDARSRSYLGSAYETILSDFIAPLNLLLTSSNQPNINLTTVHSNVVDTRKAFISEYTAYSQALEGLIATDCYGHPEDFYNKLQDTKRKRATLSSTTTTLRNLLSEYLTDVRKLKNNLGAKDGATD